MFTLHAIVTEILLWMSNVNCCLSRYVDHLEVVPRTTLRSVREVFLTEINILSTKILLRGTPIHITLDEKVPIDMNVNGNLVCLSYHESQIVRRTVCPWGQ